MTLTRAALLAAALTTACGSAPADDAGAPPPPLRPVQPIIVRAPNLDRPLTEIYPGPATPEDPVGLAVFTRINADRAAAGVAPVAWDEAAARVATAFCAAQIEERTRGHFLRNGIPPWARTALAGIFGYQYENVASWISSGQTFDRTPVALALAAQESMLAEKPPDDGHRQTILDPSATHVGVGWSERGGQFRLAQEFLTRRLARLTIERVAEDPNTVLFRGRVASPFRLDFVTFAHEPSPKPLTREQANALASYAYPTAGLLYTPEGIRSMQLQGTLGEDRLRLEPDGGFAFRFTPGQPGLWTVLFHTSTARQRSAPGGLAVLWIDRREKP